MSIKSGIGIGGAQVFDTSGITDAFYKQYLQKQKENQAYAENIANTLAKYDSTGLNDKDKLETDAMYNKVVNDYEKLQTSKLTPSEKALISSSLKQKMQKIKDFTSGALNFYKEKQDVGIEFAKNKYQYEPSALQAYEPIKNDGSYTNALKNNLASPKSLLLKRTPDNKLIDANQDKFSKFLDAASKSIQATPELSQDKKTYINFVKIEPEKVNKAVFGLLADDAFKYNLTNNFKEANPNVEPTDDNLVKFFIQDYSAKKGIDPYKYAVKREKVPEPKAPKKPKQLTPKAISDATWEQMNRDAFSSDKVTSDRALAEISAIAGKKAEIKRKQGGGYTLMYNPIVMIDGEQTRLDKPITKNVNSRGELLATLRDAGVTGSVAGAFRRLEPITPKAKTSPKKELSWAEKQKQKNK